MFLFSRFEAFIEHSRISLLSSGTSVGFIPYTSKADGYLCLQDIVIWSTNGELKTLSEIENYFEVGNLYSVEDKQANIRPDNSTIASCAIIEAVRSKAEDNKINLVGVASL